MRLAVLLSVLSAAVPVLAQAVEDGDPFAAYHQAIEQQVVMLSKQTARNVENVPQPAWAPLGPAPSVVIEEFARTYWRGQNAPLRAALARLERYRPVLEPILEQEGVPTNLVAVVLVESAAEPLALSAKHARGLWQFIPETARQYGLTVTSKRDERVHVALATRAAARYLRDLYTTFGNWQLALAAYNAGPETIRRALLRGRVSRYAELSAARLLPEETINYVPAVLSAMEFLGMHHELNSAHQTRMQPEVRIVYAPASISD